MIGISASQIPAPVKWQDFEGLCCDLWSKIWGDENTQKNGRGGQNQHGVDVSGKNLLSSGGVCGVQCKGKDNYSQKKLTITELESEVDNAKSYSPSLKVFIVATTGPKDVKVETRAREITEEHEKLGLFSVVVFGWADIVEKLETHTDIFEKHYPWMFRREFKADEYFFDFWKLELNPKKMSYHCNQLPMATFNLHFSEMFLHQLKTYLMKCDEVLDDCTNTGLSVNLHAAALNFNKVAYDVLATCYQYEESVCDIRGEWTYWVRDSHLAYEHKGKFIEYRKGVLRALFYRLIQAANYIIKVRNKNSRVALESYIGFRDDFAYNSPIVGELYPSPEYYPMYDDESEGDFYPGLFAVDSSIRLQIYPKKPLFTSILAPITAVNDAPIW